MLSKDASGASFAAPLHTLAQLPGVEPHATLVASPGSCCASTRSDQLGAALTSSCNQGPQNPTQSSSTRLHGLLELSLSSNLANFAFPPIFDRQPAPWGQGLDTGAA